MANDGKALVLKIQGMDCAEEVAILKREVGPLVGGDSNLSFDILKGQMTVLPTASQVGLDPIVQAIRKTGMNAVLHQPERSGRLEQRTWWDRHGRLTLTMASGALTAVGFLLHRSMSGSWAEASRCRLRSA